MLKHAILVIICSLPMLNIYGQAEKNIPDYLKQRFLGYTATIPWEEIFVHSDREEYIAGEDLWFNVYLMDRQSFKPSLNSRIVYFELLNAENRPVVQKRILIDKGFGPGQIILPDSLSSGIYTIRAYTSWMKNFLPNNCFMKQISVFNTLNTSAFKGKLPAGKGIEKGTSNNIIEEYRNTGVTLRVNNSKPDTIEIVVKADNNFRIINDNLFHLFIQTHGNINHVSTEKMTEEITKVNVPKSLLSAGINQITIFNAKGEPIIERLIYTPLKDNKLLILRSADSCILRNKIILEIVPGEDVSTKINPANLSISVASLANDQEQVDMDDYMIFGTEFGLDPWNTIKSRKIKQLPPEVMDSILMHVSSNWINWSTILAEDLPHFKYPIEKEDHFILGKLINNNQQAAISGELVVLCSPGKVAGFQYARTDSEGNFSFNIHIDEALKDLIIMPDDINNNNRIVIESSFSDQYLLYETSVDSTENLVAPQISKLSVNYQVSRIYEVSSHTGPINPIFAPQKPKRFYGKPDIELIMADYISLPVMEEVFFEILPNVSLKKKNSEYEISITDRIDDSPYKTIPSLLIDGVIIKDPALIINLVPEIIEKIDVIKEKYVVGNYFFPGIINVITKSGDFSSVALPDYMIRMPYRVTESVWSFVSPDYSVAEISNKRIADFRNTLYWNPSVKLDKDGKARIEFWSSDNKSDYIINIQGITQDGQAFSLKKTIKVK